MTRIISLQSLSCVQLFVTPWTAACQASLSITNSRSSCRFMSIESVMPSSHLILCHSLLPPAANPSQHQSLFQWVNSSHEVAKVLLDSIFKSRDITDKGPSNQSYHFSSSCVWMWQLDHKEGWAPKNWCFWTACWRRLLRVPWTARRSNQSILKETSPE